MRTWNLSRSVVLCNQAREAEDIQIKRPRLRPSVVTEGCVWLPLWGRYVGWKEGHRTVRKGNLWFFFFAGSAGQVAGACPDLSKERQWQSGNASRAKRQEWHSPNPGNDSFVARASPSYASVQDHAPIASSRFAIKLRPPKGDADFLRLGLAYLPDLLFDEGKHWQ